MVWPLVALVKWSYYSLWLRSYINRIAESTLHGAYPWGFRYIVSKNNTFIICCVAGVIIARLHGQNSDFGACLLYELL